MKKKKQKPEAKLYFNDQKTLVTIIVSSEKFPISIEDFFEIVKDYINENELYSYQELGTLVEIEQPDDFGTELN